ncbi:MAG: SET domain-containing protein-lysine N-methyltransferase [Acidimicrobiaceae bacterium]|nr:SET domain-containing protein-lysine N-methyltransferase [Acidimicrobiaceae bacterium]
MSDLIPDIEAWFSEGLEVRQSPIHGYGLYATIPFRAGHRILRLGGYLFHISERRANGVMPSTTTPLSEEVILAELATGCKDYSDHINHSCDPNIGFTDAISIVTIRDVGAGEELVTDYAFWECDAAWRLRIPCNCNTPVCRRNITGEDWKAFRAADPLYRYFSPFLRRRILTAKGKEF